MPPPVVVHGVHKEKGNVMNSSVKKCRCGRSETGICNGSHSLTEEEYKKKKADYVAATLAAQFPGSMFSEIVRSEKEKTSYARPSLDMSELDAYIQVNLSKTCGPL